MSRNFLFFGCVIVFAGCGSYVPTVNLHELSAAQRHEINSVEVFDTQLLSRANYKILDIAEGHSCQNKTWDPPATRVAAIQQLKYFAREMGGNGISDIRCGGREGTSARTNCWELISCTANVLKVATPDH